MCQKSFAAGYFLIFSMFYPTSLIGNEYKGHLTSTMISGFVPNVPSTLQILVANASIPYFTTTKPAVNQRFYSILTDIVLPDFIRQTQEVDQIESSFAKFLLKLSRNVKFISEIPSAVVYNQGLSYAGVRWRKFARSSDGQGPKRPNTLQYLCRVEVRLELNQIIGNIVF
ncbi:unnamed protein product [Orchesella dallaii]|uniref:Uncharacterized protein n=1 Tax=Orchesella dallaii TaxID=48710 RepID=A0ABP1RP05_9HEXA